LKPRNSKKKAQPQPVTPLVPLAEQSANGSGPTKWIQLRGVRVHNLKNVDVDLPRGQTVAICGVSGSGKTSLAIDTLYAEGQRRYIESFSAYTRQFLERLEKPDYDRIDGLTPALAVTRGISPRGNRSTVGTTSETLDYLRLLYAKIASLKCYSCGRPVAPATPQSAGALIERLPIGVKLMICFLTGWEDVAERATILAELQQDGLVRMIAGNQLLSLSDDREKLTKALPKRGKVWVVVDRLRGGESPARSTESLDTAFRGGAGEATLLIDSVKPKLSQSQSSEEVDELGIDKLGSLEVDGSKWSQLDLSTKLTCSVCKIDFPPASPQLFSFNSPLGACPKCEGFGDTVDLDMNLIVPDNKLSIAQGAIAPWNSPAYNDHQQELMSRATELDIPTDVPFSKLSKRQVAVIRQGDAKVGYAGLAGFFAWLERKKYKMHVRVFLSRWRSYNRCDQCGGKRLKPEALSYKLMDKSIAELCDLPVQELVQLLASLQALDTRQLQLARVPLEQVLNRLSYLQRVGLGYLTLDRTLRTLSGGEVQRTALTAALGSSLVNMLYVLDEPSVGLHPHDVLQLGMAIDSLKGRGNTVVLIEHEEELLQQADWVVEVGPTAGSGGGQIVFSGPRPALIEAGTLTGDYLSGKRLVPRPGAVRQPTGWLTLTKCSGHNLKNIDVSFPLGVLCLVTGVSGAGKSSLVQDTLYGAIANRLTVAREAVLPFDSLLGLGQIDQCMLVDQSPVSRSPRSNPVTFVKAFDEIRQVFASTQEAKLRGITAGHFSFNSELGRCQRCQGDGILQIDMQFLADIQMTCPDCKGSRYRHEILQIRYRDHSIADVLQLTVRDAQNFFRGQGKVQQKLEVLTSVGLDYLQLGQAATTLSAGEGQRLKLAGFLAGAIKKKTLFILDEPTTGLHTHDIVQLLDCFDALLAAGNSLIIVEHNLHLMAAADYIIDLGPGPAEQGGYVVAAGTPAVVASCAASVTAQHLHKFINR
jgi:excinuclease ABC subunit A